MKLLTFYLAGVVAVAMVLAWSLIAAWAIFLGLTTVVFFLAYHNIFPSTNRREVSRQIVLEAPVTKTMREYEWLIARGFEEKNLQAQWRTLETLQKIFARKVRRRLGLNEAELTALLENPEKLEATIGEADLVQLLASKLWPDKDQWNLDRLGSLISKVEDWRS